MPDVPTPLTLQTYEGSGQAVHPDFVAPASNWPHRLFYLAITPYAWGRANRENPSLYASVDGVSWRAAPRAPMPLATPQTGHLSDPDMLHDPERNELLLYYRQASGNDRIFLRRSHNGTAWTPAAPLFDGPPSSILSPAIVRRGSGEWLMWSVNANGGCYGAFTSVEMRHSSDGALWSDPQPVRLPTPGGFFAWHIDVQWIPERSEYWAIFPIKARGTCATTAVYIASSRDGIEWNTVPAPIMTAGVIPALQHIVYRSTFAYDPRSDVVTIWYSGARYNGERYRWRLAVQRRMRKELFEAGARETSLAIPRAQFEVRATFSPP